MYYIGIDISKYKHDCFICDETGIIINENFSFKNDSKGFNLLLEELSKLDNSKTIKIGLESTGHYGINLKLFLEKNNYSFMEFNPVLIKKFINGQTLRKTKTDKVDAYLIAKYLMTVTYVATPKNFYLKYSLKKLTRYREDLIKSRSKSIVKITNILDHIFPEFKPFFKNNLGKTALYILNKYHLPSKISNMRDYETIQKISHGKFTNMQFIKLKNLAKDTIGESNNYLELELKLLLSSYFNTIQNIEVLDNEIISITNKLNSPILSIPGIGKLSAATIIAEYGDICNFKSSNAMLAYAGLEPSVIQSGTELKSGKMVKRGSGHLRYILMNVAMFVVLHNATFSVYYYKKREEGKSHRVALSHVAKKLIRIIYYLEINNTLFDASKLV